MGGDGGTRAVRDPDCPEIQTDLLSCCGTLCARAIDVNRSSGRPARITAEPDLPCAACELVTCAQRDFLLSVCRPVVPGMHPEQQSHRRDRA